MAIALALMAHVIILNLIPTHWPAFGLAAAITANAAAFAVTASFIVTWT